MKIVKTHYILVLCFCLCIVSLLFVALYPWAAGPVAASGTQPTQQDLAQELAGAEQALQEHREELAGLLRAYYMGHASERETKRLIDQVEAERLYVEELRGTLENM